MFGDDHAGRIGWVVADYLLNTTYDVDLNAWQHVAAVFDQFLDAIPV